MTIHPCVSFNGNACYKVIPLDAQGCGFAKKSPCSRVTRPSFLCGMLCIKSTRLLRLFQTVYYIVRTFPSVCDGTQKTDNFSGTKYFGYRYRYFFGTKFFRYRFRDFLPIPAPRLFPVQNFSNTISNTTRKIPNTGTHYKSSKFLNFDDKNQFRYQI